MTRTNFLASSFSLIVKVVTFTLLQEIWCSNQGGSQNCDYNQNLDTAHANISKYGKTKDFDSAMMIINKNILVLKDEFGDTEEEYIKVFCGGQYYYCDGTKFICEGTAQEIDCNPSTSKSIQYKHKVVLFDTEESKKTLQKVRKLLNLPPTLPNPDTTSIICSKFMLINIPYFYYESQELLGTLNYKTNSEELRTIILKLSSPVNTLQVKQPIPVLSSDNYISRCPYNPTLFDDIAKGVNLTVFIPTVTYIMHETSFYYPLNSRLKIHEVIAHKKYIFESHNIACISLLVNNSLASKTFRFCNGFYMYLVFLDGPNEHYETKSKEECTEILTFQLLISRFGFRYEKRTEKPNICVEKSRIYVYLHKLYNLHQTFFYNEKHLRTTVMIGFKDFYDPNDLILVPYIYIEYENPEEYELFLCLFDDKLILAGFIRIEVRN